MNWISVKERLPQINTKCIATDGTTVKGGAWYGKITMQSEPDFLFVGNINITHWMPLPEPPKTEQP